jgi:hypothetical protein
MALKVLGSDTDSSANADDFIETQYKGKEHLKAFKDTLISAFETVGGKFKIDHKENIR